MIAQRNKMRIYHTVDEDIMLYNSECGKDKIIPWGGMYSTEVTDYRKCITIPTNGLKEIRRLVWYKKKNKQFVDQGLRKL